MQLLSNYKCGCLDYELTEGDDYKDIIPASQILRVFDEGFPRNDPAAWGRDALPRSG